jgi:hypothetical protein
VPGVRREACGQTCTRSEEIPPAPGVPRARMAAGEDTRDSNEISQRQTELVIRWVDDEAKYRLGGRSGAGRLAKR